MQEHARIHFTKFDGVIKSYVLETKNPYGDGVTNTYLRSVEDTLTKKLEDGDYIVNIHIDYDYSCEKSRKIHLKDDSISILKSIDMATVPTPNELYPF